MITYQGRSEEDKNAALKSIMDDINEARQFIDDTADEFITTDKNNNSIKLDNTTNNEVLMRSTHRKRNKRIVNKHFLTDAAPNEKITNEDLMKLLKEDIITIGLDNKIKNKPKMKKADTDTPNYMDYKHINEEMINHRRGIETK